MTPNGRISGFSLAITTPSIFDKDPFHQLQSESKTPQESQKVRQLRDVESVFIAKHEEEFTLIFKIGLKRSIIEQQVSHDGS